MIENKNPSATDSAIKTDYDANLGKRSWGYNIEKKNWIIY